MNAARLINLAPMLILIAFLAYSSYSLHASLPGAAAERVELEKELQSVMREIVASGTATTARLDAGLRDPFQVITSRRSAAVAPLKLPEAASPAAPDPLAEIVQDLRLDATLIHGRDQIAVISGKIYAQGQQIQLDTGSDEPAPTLVLVSVFPTRVVLRGDTRSYVLSYPDQLGKRKDQTETQEAADASEIDPAGQLALFQKLLSSPLGALGKSVIGKRTLTDPAARFGPVGGSARARRARSPGTAPRGAGIPPTSLP
jgi:hypothetical protein